MSQIPLVSANLATVTLESVFYGMFLVLSSASIFFHISRAASSPRTRPRRFAALWGPIFLGSILTTITVTGHWITTVVRLFDAFVNYNGGNSPLEYYSAVWLSSEAAQTSFLIATLVSCDSMLIYRLWIVWNHNYWVVILPMCAELVLCVAGIVAIYLQTQVRGSIFATALTHWVTACYACTFVTNVYSSCGIAYRVWAARQRMNPFSGLNLMDVLVTMVESAAIYTSYTIFFLGTYEAKSNLQFFTIDTLCPMAGIAFMLINVRVGLGWAQRANTDSMPAANDYFGRGGTTHTEMSFAMRPVTVEVPPAVHPSSLDDVERSQDKTDYGLGAGL